ncbi:DNA-directed DNA polymerase I [Sulfolobus acidocaldarius]|uniref:DNA polymerase 1 n=4 Tax=Sulfolobus acidocaldarius TaxID=2285 RepID=DPOL1_SULAC|nr:DNA-directed DNA polymerase I [Sulfolobus acidocaldarius]P95690.2 RecName: Full=DNA polymerase 1; AltName: Full=DNA polymerase I [Sulfolobus acidocaldarius DSM 639]AAY80851.1 DNA polymerase I [Sulfolobus acidocaldarius DSM 639]AGE71451.1 DNA polymerase I [Sulfolobus acidocaldarius N8]AGE73724.1 DNA polymerase I [Sulfolobus acidocaldarius Ron12/I]ALU30313.1 DNA polymerase I [Sulfolobus acidocaldarius]ALU31031.1 DNA polymerase I [Sulfolobus acidocaldarius]
MSKQATLFDFSIKKNESKEQTNQESVEVPKQTANRTKIEWIKEAEDGKVYFLLQVDYDGKKSRAVCKLYDKEGKKIYIMQDESGHKPYFLTDIDPDKVNKITKVVRDPSFDHLELINKVDPYTGKKIRLTKIVVKDPLAVRRMRSSLPKAYEAHIKYYNNYVYDNGLIPGLIYKVNKGKLTQLNPELKGEEINEIKKAFADADEMTKETVNDWIPILETEVPDIKRVSLDIEVYTPNRGRIPDPERAEFPIISVALAGNDGSKIVLALKREDVNSDFSKKDGVQVEIFDSEKKLLARLFEIIREYPMLLTFNGDDFDIPYIYFRALRLNFSPEEVPLDVVSGEGKFLAGIHIDLYKFFFNRAVRIYAFEGKYSEYSLDAVATALLGISKVKLDTFISFLDIDKLIEYNLRDAEITLKLTTFNNNLVLKLMVLLARISKLGLEELTRTEVSTWIKNLYYWEHRKRNWLIPLKEEILVRSNQVKTAAVIKGKKYKGAVVIDPPAGVYFNVVVLDFASLYPSIIKNWNISYETIDIDECTKKVWVEDETGEKLHYVCMDKPGITAVITGLIRDFRVKVYKKKAKYSNISEEQRSLYDVVQRAMKVFINATYGVFGAENFPLYAPAVAESVTAIGRYIITTTYKQAEKLNLKVIYGDTDSLFLYNPTKDKLEELIKFVKQNFNLDLEVDKSYKYVAFSGLKKNYFGVYPDGKTEIKGMLAKKRNTPEFIKKEFAEIKNMLASLNSPNDIPEVKNKLEIKIKDIYNKLRNKGYNLDDLAFRIMLSKPLDSYTKNTPQHVKAGLQLRAFGVNVLPRDVIMFVKVKSKDGVKPIQLAKISEIDIEKYVETLRTTFEQILKAFGISWDEIVSTISIDSFFGSKK